MGAGPPSGPKPDDMFNGIPQQTVSNEIFFRSIEEKREHEARKQHVGLPGEALTGSLVAAIRRAVTHLPPVSTELAPHIHPPFRGRTFDSVSKVVINPNAATGDALAIAGGAILAAAEASGFMGVVIPVLNPATLTATVPILTFTIPQTTRAVFQSFIVHIHSLDGFKALRFSVSSSGRLIFDEIEIDAGSPQRDVFFTGGQNDVVTINARNLDLNSAYLVETTLSGWTYPVEQGDDSLISTMLRSDPGDGGIQGDILGAGSGR
jgi:hypothetical protein